MATQAKRDYYEVLGVERTASEQEIEEAYRKLVQRIRNAGGITAIDNLLQANRAHAVLRDSIKRLRYDKLGTEGPTQILPAKRNYYEVLGVSPDATQQQIQEAYEKLILGIRNTGGLRFIDGLLEANRAKTVLTDSAKRARYDELGFSEAAEEEFPRFEEFDRKILASEVNGNGFSEALGRLMDLFGDAIFTEVLS